MSNEVLLRPEDTESEPPRRSAGSWIDPGIVASSADEATEATRILADRQAESVRLANAAVERGLPVAQEMLIRHLSGRGNGEMAPGEIQISGEAGHVHVRGLGLLVSGERAPLNVGAALVADPVVLLAVGGGERALHWTLLPGGPSVTARADALRALHALHGRSELTFRIGHRPVELPPLSVDGGAWSKADENEWRLFEDLACLEEWTGVSLPMPTEVNASEATDAAQAASWVRTQQVRASLRGPVVFKTDKPLAEDPDEVRVFQDFGIELFGAEVPLGTGRTKVALKSVERRPFGSGEEVIARAQSDDLIFWLESPPGRRGPPVRTQSTLAWTLTGASGTNRIPSTVDVSRPAGKLIAEIIPLLRARDTGRFESSPRVSEVLDDIRADRDL